MSAYTWTAKTQPAGGTGVFGTVAGGGDNLVAIWNTGPLTQVQIAISLDDGATWAAATTVPAETQTPLNVAFGGGVLLLTCQGTPTSALLRSTNNGDDWAVVASNPFAGWTGTEPTATAIGSDGADNWLLCNVNGPETATSNDNGFTWVPHLAVGAVTGFDSVIWDGTQWVAIAELAGGDTVIGTSADGITWSFTAATNVNPIFQLAHAAGKYVAGCAAAAVVVASSPAGLATAAQTDLSGVGITGGAIPIWDAFNSLFLVLDGNGNTAYSPDAVTWHAGDPLPTGVAAQASLSSGGTGAFSLGSGDGSVAESAFSPDIVLPNLTGLTLDVATATLAAAGFTSWTVQNESSSTFPTGQVITTSPAPGTSIDPSSTVIIFLSTGPAEVAVPELIGLSQNQAEATLAAAGLSVGNIVTLVNEAVPFGNVIDQSPQAGTEVPGGSSVSITVSVVAIPVPIEQTIISQFAQSPIICQLVQSMGQWFNQSTNWNGFFQFLWNLDTAEGFGLNFWGKIVGVSRLLTIPNEALNFGFKDGAEPPDFAPFGQGPFRSNTSSGAQTFLLPDPAYYVLILAKALANISATTAPALNRLLVNLFPGRGRVYVRDNLNMSFTVLFEFQLTPVEFAILTNSGAFPHPAGVSFNVIVVDDTLFGFAEALPFAQPFDSGTFYSPAG